MSAQLLLLPIISIDSDEVREWLERQLLHLLHKSRPKFIPRASFNTIITPNEVHQADVLYTRHIKSGRTIYLFYLNLVDVASRYKATVPIGVALRGTAKSIKNIQGILTSTTIAKCLEKIYDDPENPLIWPKVFLSNKGSEFKGECEKLLRKHGVEIQKAKFKKTIGIAERYNLTFQKQFYSFLDAHDLLDSSSNIIELEDLPSVVDSIVEDLNNSVTRLLGISPADAIKKKSVFAKPSKPRKGPMGYDEKRLSYGDSVIYLLDLSEYKGGRRRATDMNWSSKIYNIRESLVQKNQPVLYWLEDDEGNGLERSFVREELQIIPPDIEYPPQWVLAI
ncbi:hypothetical protein RCL_jg25913.t1 [Rhizophagus clarus]|uniref:Integrase catalytic domain-containing protein n=1 Tax=Rhizophagus clarus TaxID=94130 RepID=A0A8H3L1G5_9GLOM|nr:hypothetical protein RCL_jg25913.t1 [Rhizophagus clarus]